MMSLTCAVSLLIEPRFEEAFGARAVTDGDLKGAVPSKCEEEGGLAGEAAVDGGAPGAASTTHVIDGNTWTGGIEGAHSYFEENQSRFFIK